MKLLKSLISTCLLLFFSGTAIGQLDCSPYKIGVFQNMENGEAKSKIERGETTQTEFVGDMVITLSIKWLDNCSYRLSFLEANDAYWKENSKDDDTPDLIVEITSGDENSYTQECKFVGIKDFTYVSTMVKLE